MKNWMFVCRLFVFVLLILGNDGASEDEGKGPGLGKLREPLEPYPSTYFEGCEALLEMDDRWGVFGACRHIAGSSDTVLEIASENEFFYLIILKRDLSTGNVVSRDRVLDGEDYLWLDMLFRLVMKRPLMKVDPLQVGKIGDRYYSYSHLEYMPKVAVSESPDSAFLRRLENMIDLLILSLSVEGKEAIDYFERAIQEARELTSQLKSDSSAH